MRRSLLTSLQGFLRRHRGLLLVTLAALGVRLLWNLALHNPWFFAFSDMGAYLSRADEMLTSPWLPEKSGPAPHLRWSEIVDWLAPRLFGPKSPGSTLYPYGTHVFIAGVKAVFGIKNRFALGAAFALVGALAVGYAYAMAARLSPRPSVRRAVALILIFYYPWISLGGYALSEAPFLLCVTAVAFHGLRLADEGRRGDAWMLGTWLALGAAVRPQVLASIPLLVALFVFRRRVFRRFTLGLVPRVALPLAVVLALSAWRVHWHLGTKVDADHLVSTNGPLNRVFGRCHNIKLTAAPPKGRGGWFGPPALGALNVWEEQHGRPIFALDPAFGTTLEIKGQMWDAAPNVALADACVKVTGPLRQIKYAITHVVLLWGYNVVWPDMGNPVVAYRITMAAFCIAHAAIILPPAALAMFLAFRRRHARTMLVALHAWALLLTAMLYFGDTRYRAPYDGILTVLAVAMFPEIRRRLRVALERYRERRDASARATSSSWPGSGSAESAPSAAASATSRMR